MSDINNHDIESREGLPGAKRGQRYVATTYLSEPVHDAMRVRAAEQGVSFAAVIREACEAWAEQAKKATT